MNYVDIEKRLVESIHMTYDEQVEDSLMGLWNVARKVDWLVLMTDYKRNISGLFQTIGTSDGGVLERIVSAAVLRIPELSSPELLDLMCDSIKWRILSKSNDDPINQDLKIAPMKVFFESPDIIVLYMLSNMNLDQLQRRIHDGQ